MSDKERIKKLEQLIFKLADIVLNAEIETTHDGYDPFLRFDEDEEKSFRDMLGELAMARLKEKEEDEDFDATDH